MSVVVQNLSGASPTSEDAALWQEGLELGFPVVADLDGEFWPIWDPEGVLPMAYILDRDGVIVWRKAGGTEVELAEIEALLLKLL